MVVDVPEDDALMTEEIFGPILPIITVDSLEEGIEYINRGEKPLALYVFSDESHVRRLSSAASQAEMNVAVIKSQYSCFFKAINTVLEKTSSGGFCSNDGILHMTLPGLPFGGVGRCEPKQLIHLQKVAAKWLLCLFRWYSVPFST